MLVMLNFRKNRFSTGASKKASAEENKENKAYLTEKYKGQLLDRISKEELQETVKVPMGVDSNEWLATNSKS